jgi:hypothetical protein
MMDEDRRQALTVQRLMQWESDCALRDATPVILIAVSRRSDTPTPLHVFVPMHDPVERQLMVEMFRHLADALEREEP